MTKELIKKYNIKAKKSLGQNFLIDDFILNSIANYIDISGRNIVEVGPGYGALTEKLLLSKPSKLDLVEIDKDMINILESRVLDGDLDTTNTNFSINNIDVLKYQAKNEKYSVIANIPYYITSPILRHFLYDIENKPENMIILMQKDVGDKILKKNKNKSSVLSLYLEKKCSINEVIIVPKESFIPSPKVESSVLYFEFTDTYEGIDDDFFLTVIKIAFSEPRKKLIKNLAKGGFDKVKILEFLTKKGFSENTRAEDLDLLIWIELITEKVISKD